MLKVEPCALQVLIPKWVFGDTNIRFLEELAGGAMMDAGTYAVSIMRLLTGSEPRVESASASMRPGSKVVDGAMRARLSWDSGIAGTLHASLQHEGWLPVTEVQVEGERGCLTCKGFIVPFFGNSLRVTTTQAGSMVLSDPAALSYDKGAAATAAAMSNPAFTGSKSKQGEEKRGRGDQVQWTERVFGEKQQTSYYHQLERFTTDLQLLEGRRADRDAGNVKAACAFDAYDSVANAAILDACFEAAGLPLRMPTAEWQQQQQQQQQQYQQQLEK
uniref:GFO/IDH/MocA-like oxidoreductase domain-containing protein n=1 Tax=Dunaliella tertiolecta TaxID=3047 RepID=A0A7S3QWU4_DUNTE